MKIIVSLISEYGGTGKTTVAVNLAKSLSRQGVKTVIVDFSPQNSIYLQLSNSPIQPVGLADIIMKRLRYGKKFIQKIDKNMGVLVNGVENIYDTIKYEDAIVRSRTKVAKIVNALTRDYDVIILDNSAGVGRVTQLAMSLSTHLLAIAGLTTNMSATTCNIIEMIRQSRARLNKQIKFVGILLNRLAESPETDSELRQLYYHWPFFLRTVIRQLGDENSVSTAGGLFDALRGEFLALTGYAKQPVIAQDINNDLIANKLAEIDYCTVSGSSVGQLVYHKTAISTAPSTEELNSLYRSERWDAILEWAVDATGMQHGFILDDGGLLLSEYNNVDNPLLESQESVIRLGNRFRESATDYIQFNIGKVIINVLFLRIKLEQQHATELFQICLSGEQVLPSAYRTKIVNLFAENIFKQPNVL